MIIGSAEIELRPNVDHFAADARNRLKGIGGDLGEAGSGLSSLTAKISAVGPAVAAATAAASAAASGLVSIIGALGPAFVAVGVAGAGSAAAIEQGMLVTKFALEGVSQALAGNEKALAALTPQGQEFVKTLQAVQPEIEKVRSSAQRGLFPGLTDAIQKLANHDLPILRDAARETGDAIGDVALQGAQLAASGPFRRDFATIASANAGFLRNFGTAGLSLVDALRSVYVAALPLIGTFSQFAVSAAASIDAAVQAGRESGKLQAFFQGASDAASQLGGILADLGVAIFNVFSQGADVSGQGFLDALTRGAQAARDFTESVAGQNSIRTFFETGRTNLEALGRLATGVIGLFHDLSGAGTPLAPLLDKISANLLPALGTLIENASASKALDALVDALVDVVNTLATIEAGDSSLKAFAETLGFLARGADAILQNVPGATKALGAFLVVAGGAKALSLVGLGGVVRAIGAALLSLAGTAATAAVSYAASMLGIATATEASTGRVLVAIAKDLAARAASAAESVAIAALYVGSWIAAQAAAAGAVIASTAAQVASLAVRGAALVAAAAIAIGSFIATAAAATAAGIATAAAFLLPLAPIILIGAAVVGLVVLIVKNWDTIKSATAAAWGFVVNIIRDHWQLILAIVLGPLGVIIGQIISHWAQIRAATSAAWSAVVSIITGAVNGIGNAIGRIAGFAAKIGGYFTDAVSAVTRHIGAIVKVVAGLPQRILGAIVGLDTLLTQAGVDLVMGFVHGIENSAHLVIDAAKNLAGHVPTWVKKVLMIGSPSKLLEQLGQDTGKGFAIGLSESTDAEITTELDNLTTLVKNNAKKLGDAAVEGVVTAVRVARPQLRAFAKEVADTFADFTSIAATTRAAGNLANLGVDATTGAVTGASIVTAFQDKVTQATTFAQNLVTLANEGLNQQALADLAAAGAEQAAAAAQAIVDGGASIIPTLNALQKQISAAAIEVAKTGSTAMFVAGQETAKGLAAGFRSQRKIIEQEMLEIAKTMKAAIRKALGIKSPSSVFAAEGVNTAAGFVVGLDSQRKAVKDAMTRLVTPDLGSLVAASQVPLGGGIVAAKTFNVTLPPATSEDSGQQLIDGVRLLDALYGR